MAKDLHAGRQPRGATIASGEALVKDVCNRYLTFQMQKLNGGEITAHWLGDCRTAVAAFARFLGANRIVSDLTVEDFQRFRLKIYSFHHKRRCPICS